MRKVGSSYYGRDAVVTVFNDEQLNYFKKRRIYCKRNLSSGKTEIVRGNIKPLIKGPWQCLLTTYRMICPFYAAKNDETVKFEIGANSIIGQKLEFHEFTLSKPDNKPREFVSCMSRMIAFEDWALFLIQMETFRFYGGSLVVAYIDCAIKKVYELMKIYEMDGLLKIRHAYKASDNPNIPYDSDAQTEFSNQLTNSNLCLFEFRESAEFIAFTDWDDVLFVRQNSGKILPTFADTFRYISFLNPSVGGFSISRYPFVNEKAFRPKSYKFSMEKLFNQLHYSLKTTPPKLVVRPKDIGGIWIHALGNGESKTHQEIKVNSTIAALFHIKNLILDENESEISVNKLMYTENGNHLIVGKVLQQNMIKMFKKQNFTFNQSEYSHSQT
uniref:Glycosyltransferase family 92 protein n=1 Tax=Panagrolaimus sp. PS1159 TaxID=55785 RepID=A0AC35GGG0_9BILA